MGREHVPCSVVIKHMCSCPTGLHERQLVKHGSLEWGEPLGGSFIWPLALNSLADGVHDSFDGCHGVNEHCAKGCSAHWRLWCIADDFGNHGVVVELGIHPGKRALWGVEGVGLWRAIEGGVELNLGLCCRLSLRGQLGGLSSSDFIEVVFRWSTAVRVLPLEPSGPWHLTYSMQFGVGLSILCGTKRICYRVSKSFGIGRIWYPASILFDTQLNVSEFQHQNCNSENLMLCIS